MKQTPRFDLLFEATGVKMDNFGTNRVAQIVTAVHKTLLILHAMTH